MPLRPHVELMAFIYTPQYDALLNCVTDALAQQQSDFGECEFWDSHVPEKTTSKHDSHGAWPIKNIYQNKTEFVKKGHMTKTNDACFAICHKKI